MPETYQPSTLRKNTKVGESICTDQYTRYKRFAQRAVPPATLAHDDQWNGTTGRKQVTCKCQELHAPSRKATRTPHACAHIPQVGFIFSSLIISTKEKAQHSTAPQKKHRDEEHENGNFSKKKYRRPLSCNYFHQIETPFTRQKKNETAEFLSQPGTPPAPMATTSPSIRSG